MTQRDLVLGALRDGPVCGTVFLNMHIPRYAARIHELRAIGHQITSERCKQDHYHITPQTIYRLGQ